jgi:hypothetical protein
MAYDIFKNLTWGELEQAIFWYERLLPEEQLRVHDAIEVILNSNVHFKIPHYVKKLHYPSDYALIVAGTSIDGDTYKDIDLFLLPRVVPDIPTYRRYEVHHNARGYLDGSLPEHVHFVYYENLADSLTQPDKPEIGAYVTVSVIFNNSHFGMRRSNHRDDILEQDSPVGAEEFIEYNRLQNSKFFVLCRNFALPEQNPV